MKLIKALHIASFNGNIGDNANHNGFRRHLRDTVNVDIEFENLEMREFYQSWGLRDFNSQEFIELCNSKDLIIFGGGNFFELKWDYSHTGTTINLSPETMELITTPILFHGVGCDAAKGASKEAINKFDKFLEIVSDSDKYFVSVRNDGSMDTIHKLYGSKYDGKIIEVPDGAFFLEGTYSNQIKYSDRKLVGINIVNDMREIRFDSTSDNGITYDQFISKFATTLDDFLDKYENYDLLFYPHIYSDLLSIYDVINKLENTFQRTRVTVAPLLTGEGSENYIFGMYKDCDFIMGMRFHTNVCSIAQSIPTIALSSYKKIDDLYSGLLLNERVVKVNIDGFESKIRLKIDETIQNLEKIKTQYNEVNQVINNESSTFYNGVNNWLDNHVNI